MQFEHPFLAVVAFVLFIVLYILSTAVYGRRYFGVSEIRFFRTQASFRHLLMAQAPEAFFFLTSMVLFLAISQPKLENRKSVRKNIARDIVLVIDMSASMGNAFTDTLLNPGYQVPDGDTKKIEAAKKAAIDFIKNRKNDRFAIMIFGDETFGIWPMTSDHGIVIRKIEMLNTKEGYDFLGGTNLVRAISTSIDYIEIDSKAKEPILLFISDGVGGADDAELEDVVFRMRSRNIRFYWIQMDRYGPGVVSPIKKIIGRFSFGKDYSAMNPQEIRQAVQDIERVEKSETFIDLSGKEIELFPYLCLLAVIMIIGAIFLEGYRL